MLVGTHCNCPLTTITEAHAPHHKRFLNIYPTVFLLKSKKSVLHVLQTKKTTRWFVSGTQRVFQEFPHIRSGPWRRNLFNIRTVWVRTFLPFSLMGQFFLQTCCSHHCLWSTIKTQQLPSTFSKHFSDPENKWWHIPCARRPQRDQDWCSRLRSVKHVGSNTYLTKPHKYYFFFYVQK